MIFFYFYYCFVLFCFQLFINLIIYRYLTDSGFDKNLDFSVLKNAKSLTTL